ncbi:MAG: hypothetical protein AAGJ08_00325 [Cyanobacteria bacterium P01_H01_bin.35]
MTTSANSVSQSHEALNFLGKTLCNDFQTLIEESATGWFTEDYSIAENYGELLNLAKSVRQVMQLEEDFTAFEKWLTSGFIPEELVVQPLMGNSKVKSQKLRLPSIKEESKFSQDWAKFDLLDLRTDNQETEIQETDEVSSIYTPISSYSQELSVRELPAQTLDISRSFKENEQTEMEDNLTTNDLIEKRSRQNHGVKGLRELAQMLEFSALTAETIGVNTEIFPTSAGETSQELNNQEIEEISSVSTIVPISSYSQEQTVPELPAQTPDISESLRKNDPTQLEEKLTTNDLIEKRSRQNHSVKGLDKLARLLEFSPLTAETMGVNTEISPTSAGEIPQELTEGKSHFPAQDDNSPNFSNEQVLNPDREDLLIPTKEKRNELSQISRIDSASTKNINLEDNSRSKFSDRLDLINEQEIEIDDVIDALTEEINREYRRFYSH